MNIILVCIGNFQDYIIYNLYNLLLYDNNDIYIITNKELFPLFQLNINTIILPKFKNANIKLIDTNDLDDHNFKDKSKLDKNFRNGFWFLCSLRLIYLFSFIDKYKLEKCIHLENDVICYENFNLIENKFTEDKVYATFDSYNRVIPGILFIPNYNAVKPILNNYNFDINDMENLAKFDETIILPLPIFSNIQVNNKFTKLFSIFNSIFDGAAIGQYLGGVDKRNIAGDTRGFINETCIIKYNNYTFHWIKCNELYKPYILINSQYIPINNLHIHSKELYNFLADNPLENKLINIISI